MSKSEKSNYIAKAILQNEEFFKQIEQLEYKPTDSMIETMRKATIRSQAGIFTAYVDQLKLINEKLKNAVKFRLPKFGALMQDVTKGKTTPYIIDNFLYEQHLPFDSIALEYDTDKYTDEGVRYRAGIIHVEEVKKEEGKRAVLRLTILKNIKNHYDDSYSWSMLKYSVEIDFNKVNADTKDYFDYVKVLKWDEEDKTTEEKTLINTEHEVDILLQFLLALSCRNVAVGQEFEPSKEENAKRAAKGHALKYRYNTITIKVDRPQANPNGKYGSSNGARTVSPHLRRGHIRRYENKNIWVEATVVKADKADASLKAKNYVMK